MITLYLGMLGLAAFVGGATVLGIRLKRHPSKENAEKSSRIMHFLFFAGLGAPILISYFYPGLKQLDELTGLPALPWRPFFLSVGILLALSGLYLLSVSNRALRALGDGANAFRLTHQLVEKDIYASTRNPMALGYYLFGLSIGFLSGSTLLTLVVLLGLVPAHLFFLKFFEERELELRFGDLYRQYKQKVPFLFPRLSNK